MLEKRKRKDAEATYRDARKQIEHFHQQMKSAKSDDPLPSLYTFRKLPIINMIQSPTPPADLDVAKELKSELVKKLLEANLKAWRDTAREALATIFGCSKWKNPKGDTLHPVERLNAWFTCKRCKRVEHRYAAYESLDFSGACGHQCRIPKDVKVPDRYKEWSADHFIKDAKVRRYSTFPCVFSYKHARPFPPCRKCSPYAILTRQAQYPPSF